MSTDRLKGIESGLAIKAPCRVVTNAPITLSGFQTVNGTVLAEGDENLRVIVNDQVDKTENGLYNASSGPWIRCVDFDGPRDAVHGTLVSVFAPSGLNLYRLVTDDPIQFGTSNIVFEKTDGALGGGNDRVFFENDQVVRASVAKCF